MTRPTTTTSPPASTTTGRDSTTVCEPLRKGDELIVWKLDRLGRNLADLVNTVRVPVGAWVGLRVLAGHRAETDTTNRERELIRERTVAGLKAARARGRKGRQGDALPVRRTKPVARAGPRLLNRSTWAATPAGHRLSVGSRPLPQTTRKWSSVPAIVPATRPRFEAVGFAGGRARCRTTRRSTPSRGASVGRESRRGGWPVSPSRASLPGGSEPESFSACARRTPTEHNGCSRSRMRYH